MWNMSGVLRASHRPCEYRCGTTNPRNMCYILGSRVAYRAQAVLITMVGFCRGCCLTALGLVPPIVVWSFVAVWSDCPNPSLASYADCVKPDVDFQKAMQLSRLYACLHLLIVSAASRRERTQQKHQVMLTAAFFIFLCNDIVLQGNEPQWLRVRFFGISLALAREHGKDSKVTYLALGPVQVVSAGISLLAVTQSQPVDLCEWMDAVVLAAFTAEASFYFLQRN